MLEGYVELCAKKKMLYQEEIEIGLFNRNETTSIHEWSDEKLIKELSRPSRDIVSAGKLTLEAQRRGLKNPKTGKSY